MGEFADAFWRASRDQAANQGATLSEAFVDQVQTSLDEAIAALQREAERRANVDVNFVKGHLAEVWHAETLKVAARAKGRTDIWANAAGNNKTGQDVQYGDATTGRNAELKYYKTGEETARQLGNPAYNDSQKVVPADQLQEVIAEAQRQAARNRDTRPDVAAANQHTAQSVSDRLEVDGVTSTPLTEGDAKALATDLQRDGELDAEAYGLTTEAFIAWSDLLRESGSAALHAAAFSAALSSAPLLYRLLRQAHRTGELDERAWLTAARQLVGQSANAGLRGGMAAIITGGCRSGLLGPALKSAPPAAIGMATALALNSLEHSWRYAWGEISGRELAFNTSRDTLALLMGSGGAMLGQMLIPIPLLGATLGNLVGSTLGAMSIQAAQHKVLALCVEQDWTFWGLVEQNYVVPEAVLARAGFDLFAPQQLGVAAFQVHRFTSPSFNEPRLEFQFLRRGVMAFHTIGYLS
ncbi:hypothetical protein [Pseudaeromonas paramecii]|uniref:DUF4781 domain-containing protein n=1 Tax=Pseudaeromonas paramecii TaxID=2138166 RepID=A0ABP8Q066_9GAMM